MVRLVAVPTFVQVPVQALSPVVLARTGAQRRSGMDRPPLIGSGIHHKDTKKANLILCAFVVKI